MRLEEIANTRVVTLNATDNCRKAAALMEEFNIRHLPVLDGGMPVGMVSDRDLLSCFGWWTPSSKTPDATIADWADRIPVEEVMSTPLVSLAPDAPIDRAARLMLNKKISGIPLIGGTTLVGIVTETDFLRLYNGEAPWQRQLVFGCMTAHVFTARSQDAVFVVGRLMRDKQIRHLVVMEGNSVVGMLSDRDILAGFPKNSNAADLPNVAGLMTAPVQVVRPDTDLVETAERLIVQGVSALPVVTEKGDLIGIITETDLLQAFIASSDS